MSINQVNLLGNVGGDPEVRVMNNGDKVASFSIATSEVWKNKETGEKKETTEWHRVVVFNQALIGIIEQYVKKGSKIGVFNAAIKTRKYEKDGSDRYVTEIVVGRFRGEITLEGSPKGVERDEHGYGQTRTRENSQEEPPQGARVGSMKDQLNDEIPFSPEWR